MARKKNSIFSGKDRNGFDKRTLNIINKTLASTGDIRSLNRSQRRTYERYLRAQERELRKKGYKPSKFTSEPTSLFSEHMRQNQFINDIEEVKRMGKEIKIFDMPLKDLSDQWVDIDMNDKWNILRRLASRDIRLNVDRAYASQTLREIEDMIEQNNDKDSDSYHRFADYDDLANYLYEQRRDEIEKEREWNSTLKPLTSDDALLAANRGFHGIDKARKTYNRRTRKSLDNYEPVWDSPFKFMDVEI